MQTNQAAIIRVIHPSHHIYSFGESGFLHFVTADDFNAKHSPHDSPYEINRRLGIWTAQALRFDTDQKEAFKLVASVGDDRDLVINATTFWRIIWQHTARNDNPMPLTFSDKDFLTFFEPYNSDLHSVHDWFESEAFKFQRAKALQMQTTIAPETNG